MDNEVTGLLDITSVLDPRFKVKYLEEVDEVLALVKEEGASIVHATQEKRVSHTSSSDATDDSTMIVSEQPSRKKKETRYII